jgi:hypothetical protein
LFGAALWFQSLLLRVGKAVRDSPYCELACVSAAIGVPAFLIESAWSKSFIHDSSTGILTLRQQ